MFIGGQDVIILDSVQVIGYCYVIEKSFEQKCDVNVVVEVIIVEDVGKFFDKNVVDVLQCVFGVVIICSGGEGKSVSVCGFVLDLILIQLNGNFVVFLEINNEVICFFNYILLLLNMLLSVELFKLLEVCIDEGGIGGMVILYIWCLLDMEFNFGYVNLEGIIFDISYDVDLQVLVLYFWYSKDECFGVLVGVIQQNCIICIMEVSIEDYQWYGNGIIVCDVNGNLLEQDGIYYWWGQFGFNNQVGKNYSEFFMLILVNFVVKEEKCECKGGQLIFQFKLVDNVMMMVNYFCFELQGDYIQNMLKVLEWNLVCYNQDGNWVGGCLFNGLDFDLSGSIVIGVQYQKLVGKIYYCSEEEVVVVGFKFGGWGLDDCIIFILQFIGGYSKEKVLLQIVDLIIDWDISLFWKVLFIGGCIWFEGGLLMNFCMLVKLCCKVGNQWQFGNQYIVWDLIGMLLVQFLFDLQQQLMVGVVEVDIGLIDLLWMQIEVKQNYFQVDVIKLFEVGWLDLIQFGVKYCDGKVYCNIGNIYWVCLGLDLFDYDNNCYQVGCDLIVGDVQLGFFLFNLISNIIGVFNVNVFLGINYLVYIDYLNKIYGGLYNCIEEDFVYDVNEKIYFGYFQVNFCIEWVCGNIGVCVVWIKQFVQFSDLVECFNDYFVDNVSGVLMSCDDLVVDLNLCCQGGFVCLFDLQVCDKVYVLLLLEKIYIDVLFSFNIVWDIIDNLVLCGVVLKVVVCLSYISIVYFGGLCYISEEYVNDCCVIGGIDMFGWYGLGSNKVLELFKVVQFDLGLEWYFKLGVVVGVLLFCKNVDNFIVLVVCDQQMNVGGQLVIVQKYEIQVNGCDGVLQGVELYGQYMFDFGLGVQVNYIYNDINLVLIVLDGEEIGFLLLVGSVKNQVNVMVFYENDKFLVCVLYNCCGEVVGGLNNGMIIYIKFYSQFDLNVVYNFILDWMVIVVVLNVIKFELCSYIGNDSQVCLLLNLYVGCQLYFGVNWKF